MAHARRIVRNGKECDLLHGLVGINAMTSISFSPEMLSELTDTEIVNLCRWFEKNAFELDVIENFREYGEYQYEKKYVEFIASESNDELIISLAKTALAEYAKTQNRRSAEKAQSKHKKRRGYIYLAHCDTGHYKIGRSKEPADRIRSLNTQTPVEITLIHTFEADDMFVAEEKLHRRYINKRMNGEWFELDQTDVETINGINAYRNGVFV